MEEKGITAYRLCKDCNIPNSTYYKIKNKETDFSVIQIIRISQYLNATLEYLLLGKDFAEESRKELISGKKIYRVPIVAKVNCGISYKEYENRNEYLDIVGIGHLHEPLIVIAKGDSMFPLIQNGDYLLCSNSPDKIKDKMIAVISYKTEPESHDSNVKQLRILKDGRLMLVSFNYKFDPIFVNKKDIHCIYRVEKIIRDIK